MRTSLLSTPSPQCTPPNPSLLITSLKLLTFQFLFHKYMYTYCMVLLTVHMYYSCTLCVLCVFSKLYKRLVAFNFWENLLYSNKSNASASENKFVHGIEQQHNREKQTKLHVHALPSYSKHQWPSFVRLRTQVEWNALCVLEYQP